VLVSLRGFELQFEATDHFVLAMHASIGMQPVVGPVHNSRQNCALGLTDVAGHQMGGLIHYTALAFPKTYPFFKPDLKFSSNNPNGGFGQALASGTIMGAVIGAQQVFYGLTSVEHVFDNSDHKLHWYQAEIPVPKTSQVGKNTKLDFTMTCGFADANSTILVMLRLP